MLQASLFQSVVFSVGWENGPPSIHVTHIPRIHYNTNSYIVARV